MSRKVGCCQDGDHLERVTKPHRSLKHDTGPS